MRSGSRSPRIALLLGCAACRIGFDPPDESTFDATSSNDSGQLDGAPGDGLPAVCPTTYANLGGRWYRHETNAESWVDAQAACLSDQPSNSSRFTHLAVVVDDAERGAIQNFSSATGNVWIGLSDRVTEGTFVDVSFEATSYPPQSGAPWAVGEPTGAANEDCVYVAPDGTLSDNICTATYDFVCECDAEAADPSRY